MVLFALVFANNGYLDVSGVFSAGSFLHAYLILGIFEASPVL